MLTKEREKHGHDFEISHINGCRRASRPSHTHAVLPGTAAFFLSIHEKSGWSSRSQPNLAAPSPSALPSAELSAACLEVNSFMIPLSVLPISKWLILPLWQLLVRAVARPPPSPLFFFFFSVDRGIVVPIPRSLTAVQHEIGIDFYTACSHKKIVTSGVV